MTQAQLIDGKAIALELRKKVGEETHALHKQHGIKPGLAVVLVGEDPASSVYVRNKGIATKKAGMASFTHQLPADTSEQDLLQLVSQLNQDTSVHGILVQLPLPEQINSDKVLQAIDPDKDVDGFHPINAGRLMTGQPGHVPCTPKGCVVLAKSALKDLAGLEAVVVGRSNIVGKPVAQLLLNENCTVTIAHSRTKDLASVVRRADLLIAAVGLPQFIRGDWIKPGACIIDVGINRIDLEDGKTKLVGDVAFEEALAVAGSITPVPGGVGPMTIAMLLSNTLDAARRLIS